MTSCTTDISFAALPSILRLPISDTDIVKIPLFIVILNALSIASILSRSVAFIIALCD